MMNMLKKLFGLLLLLVCTAVVPGSFQLFEMLSIFLVGFVGSSLYTLAVCVCVFMYMVPEYKPAVYVSGEPSVSASAKPALQVWVNFLPAKFSSDPFRSDIIKSTCSARVTIIKNTLLIEYPNENLKSKVTVQERKPEALRFYDVKEEIDLTQAEIQVKFPSIPDKQTMNKDYPIKIICNCSHEVQDIIFFARNSREKEVLYHKLVDASHYNEDEKLHRHGQEGTQFSRDEEFERFAKQCLYPHCRSEDPKCCYHDGKEWNQSCGDEVKNYSNKFLNTSLSRMYYDLRTSVDFLEFLREKIHMKMKKLTKLFPNYYVDHVNLSKETPKIFSISQPEQTDLGLWFRVKFQVQGANSLICYLEKKQGDRNTSSFKSFTLPWLKQKILEPISMRCEISYLKGELIVNIPNCTDVFWISMSSIPDMKARLIFRYFDKEIPHSGSVLNSMLYKVISVLEHRIRIELIGRFIYPNMENIHSNLLEVLDIDDRIIGGVK